MEEPPPPPSSRPSLARSLEPCRVLFKPGQLRREGRMVNGLLFTLLCWELVWGGALAGRRPRGSCWEVGKPEGRAWGNPSSTSQRPWFLTPVSLTLCSTFSMAHTCPHNIRSPDKCIPMSPAGHPLCSLNTQGTKGEGGGRQQIPFMQVPGRDFGPGSRIYKGQLLDSGTQTPALEIASLCSDKAQCPGPVL